MKQYAVLTMILMVTIIFVGCSKNMEQSLIKSDLTFQETRLSDTDILEVVSGANQLGYDILVKTFNGDNALISPISLSITLGMLQNGAVNDTQDVLLYLLGSKPQDSYNVNGQFNQLLSTYKSEDAQDKVSINNSLWVDHECTPRRTFVNTLGSSYDAQVYQVDLSNEKSLDLMNQWVLKNTKDLIEGPFKENFGDETLAILMNTTYFNGQWRKTFLEENTLSDAFFLEGDTTTAVSMMHQVDSFRYREKNGIQVATFPYVGTYSMKVVLPNDSMQSFLEKTSFEEFQDLLNYDIMTYDNLAVKMPQFKYEVKNPLKEVMRQMDGEIIFDPNQAEFPNIAENKNVYVSEIFQNTAIKNSEQGTEAAALTVVEMTETSLIEPKEPIEFHLNRPFIYAIQDSRTDAVIFLGILMQP